MCKCWEVSVCEEKRLHPHESLQSGKIHKIMRMWNAQVAKFIKAAYDSPTKHILNIISKQPACDVLSTDKCLNAESK